MGRGSRLRWGLTWSPAYKWPFQDIPRSQHGVRSLALRFLLRSQLVLHRTKPTRKKYPMALAVGTSDMGEAIQPPRNWSRRVAKGNAYSQENAWILITEPENFILEQFKEITTSFGSPLLIWYTQELPDNRFKGTLCTWVPRFLPTSTLLAVRQLLSQCYSHLHIILSHLSLAHDDLRWLVGTGHLNVLSPSQYGQFVFWAR